MARQGSCELLTEFALNRFDLRQQTGRLSVKAQDMDLAIDALGDGHDGFVNRIAGQREFVLKTTEEFERHGGMLNV